MQTARVALPLGRLLSRTVWGLAGLMAVTAAGCWVLGWRTLTAFGDAVIVIGALVALISVFGVFAALGDVSHGQYVLGNLPIPDALRERARNPLLDMPPSKALAISAGLCGLAAVALGLLLKATSGA